MNRLRIFSTQMYFIVLSGLIFSFAYGVHSDVSGSMSNPLALASFQAFWPYSSRFLTAWLTYKLFGASIIVTLGFRIAFAFVCWIAICALLPSFVDRLRLSSQAPYVYVSFILVMLAHYCITNVFFPYYVYDMPAIVYYLIVFLLLTQPKRSSVIMGCLLGLLFELNREPIAIALFHAAGWWIARKRDWPKWEYRAISQWSVGTFKKGSGDDELPFVLSCIVVTLLAMFMLREFILMYIFTGQFVIADRVHFEEDGHMRLLANFGRLFSSAGFIQQIFATGFGLIFFLPVIYRRLDRLAQGVVLISIIPLGILMFCNFFSELRIYDEYVPLMACLLAMLLAMANERRAA